jgi:hypothetical protein
VDPLSRRLTRAQVHALWLIDCQDVPAQDAKWKIFAPNGKQFFDVVLLEPHQLDTEFGVFASYPRRRKSFPPLKHLIRHIELGSLRCPPWGQFNPETNLVDLLNGSHRALAFMLLKRPVPVILGANTL